LVWKFETEGYVHGTPAILDDHAFVTGCDYYFRVIDIPSGKEVQKIDLGAYVAASPAVHNDRAYFGSFGNQVYCIDLKKSNIAWQYEHPKRKFPYYSSAAVTEKVVIVGGRDKMVHALNPKTGESLWTYQAKAKIESSPVIIGNKAIIASTRGIIFIFDIHSGKLLWEFDTASAIASSASFADGKFIIGNDDGIVFCFGKK